MWKGNGFAALENLDYEYDEGINSVSENNREIYKI
jgi:hypothetical protein